MDRRSRFETAAVTHAGVVRRQNEDAYLDLGQTAGLWAVADGMGGHQAGQFASRTVIEALRTIGTPGSAAELLARCEACVVEANARVLEAATRQGATIGTTLAVLLVYGLDYACLWSGDSRIYRLRDDHIALMSRDHTEVQELVDRGILTELEGRLSPRRNIITRAIGVAAHAELDIAHGVIAEGDMFLLCSDGLTNHVVDVEIHAGLNTRNAEAACRSLLQLALDRGGSDNITIVVIRVRDGSEPHPAGPQDTVVDGLQS